jgi:hypothetical protein
MLAAESMAASSVGQRIAFRIGHARPRSTIRNSTKTVVPETMPRRNRIVIRSVSIARMKRPDSDQRKADTAT